MKSHKTLAALMIVMLLASILVGCAPAATPTPKPKPTAVPPTKAPPALGTAENPIVLAMVPSGDTPEIIASAEQITALLMEKTGYVIEGSVATSYAAVIEAMGTGKAHMGTLATFAYLLAHEKYGVECALVSVRYGSPYYKGQIIARADAGITQLSDLAGKTMCWVDAASTSGFIVPSVMLKAAGVDPDTDLRQQVEAGSHDNVVLAVYLTTTLSLRSTRATATLARPTWTRGAISRMTTPMSMTRSSSSRSRPRSPTTACSLSRSSRQT